MLSVLDLRASESTQEVRKFSSGQEVRLWKGRVNQLAVPHDLGDPGKRRKDSRVVRSVEPFGTADQQTLLGDGALGIRAARRWHSPWQDLIALAGVKIHAWMAESPGIETFDGVGSVGAVPQARTDLPSRAETQC